MIEQLLQTFGGRLKRFKTPIPLFYKTIHPLFIEFEKNDHLLLMDLWFYAQINRLDLIDLLTNESVQQQINDILKSINQTDQLTYLRARQEHISHNKAMIDSILNPILAKLNQKKKEVVHVKGIEKLKIEAEIAQLISEIESKEAEERLVRSNRNLAIESIEQLEQAEEGNLVSNYYLLKKLLDITDTKKLLVLSNDPSLTRGKDCLTLSGDSIKRYFSEQIRNCTSTMRKDFFSTLTFGTDNKESTIALNLQTCEILLENDGIAQMPNLSKAIDFIVAYMLEITRAQNITQFQVLLDLLYRDRANPASSNALNDLTQEKQSVNH